MAVLIKYGKKAWKPRNKKYRFIVLMYYILKNIALITVCETHMVYTTWKNTVM